ncbi:hypothetical protein [Sphingomonas jatrophae]|uniref:hypothetical protein n=1 Tax=Sphingomonas jatrophae TaxID=1166337 RepID=UPI000A9D5673|nr:hypothetical protein [Sphingomonas jatrophae]
MADIRMSLADAATALGIAPNSVRSRFKAGKLRGERDNQGKLWVWLDDGIRPAESSLSNLSKGSIKGFEKRQIEGFEGHIRTLTEQLALAQAELASLRPRASAADRLEGEIAGLEALRDEVRADRDHWRSIAEQALSDRREQPEPRRGFWSRLFGRQGDSPSDQ